MEVGAQRMSRLLRTLQQHLIALHADGRRVVVLVDEAHAMPIETLEEIRLLSNLETDSHKLLQILLFGQQELNETLAAPACRPIRERITQRFEVQPLGAGEIATYLAHRLERAGGDRELFEPKAAAQIAKLSKGLTRRVNILADKCLLAAYSDDSDRVQLHHVKAAVADTAFGALRGGTGAAANDRSWRTVALASFGGLLVGAAAVLVPVLARAAFKRTTRPRARPRVRGEPHPPRLQRAAGSGSAVVSLITSSAKLVRTSSTPGWRSSRCWTKREKSSSVPTCTRSR